MNHLQQKLRVFLLLIQNILFQLFLLEIIFQECKKEHSYIYKLKLLIFYFCFVSSML